MESKYNRILLKLSGESLMGHQGYGIDPERLGQYAEQIKALADAGIQVAIVIGGGNIFRGLSGAAKGVDRVTGDQMGMLATVINSLALRSALEGLGQPTTAFTALNMYPIGQYYSSRAALDALDAGRVAIIAGGTGNPYFTTDTGAALRACEINAEILMKATNVDGVYDSDPRKNPDAKKFDTITYSDVLNRDLKVMDATATALCRDNKMPIMVFDINEPGCFERAVGGQNVGTTVFEEEN